MTSFGDGRSFYRADRDVGAPEAGRGEQSSLDTGMPYAAARARAVAVTTARVMGISSAEIATAAVIETATNAVPIANAAGVVAARNVVARSALGATAPVRCGARA